MGESKRYFCCFALLKSHLGTRRRLQAVLAARPASGKPLRRGLGFSLAAGFASLSKGQERDLEWVLLCAWMFI